MLDSWKIITLFVFAKIEIYFSQNMDGIDIISSERRLLWSGSDQPAEDSAAFLEQLCSGLSDLLNEYCVKGRETGQGRSRTGHIY